MSDANIMTDLSSTLPPSGAKSGASVTDFGQRNRNDGASSAQFRQSIREANDRVHAAAVLIKKPEVTGDPRSGMSAMGNDPIPVAEQRKRRTIIHSSEKPLCMVQPAGTRQDTHAKSTLHTHAETSTQTSQSAQSSQPASTSVSMQNAVMAIYGAPMLGAQPSPVSAKTVATTKTSRPEALVQGATHLPGATDSKSAMPYATARETATGDELSTSGLPLNNPASHKNVEVSTGSTVEGSTVMTGNASVGAGEPSVKMTLSAPEAIQSSITASTTAVDSTRNTKRPYPLRINTSVAAGHGSGGRTGTTGRNLVSAAERNPDAHLSLTHAGLKDNHPAGIASNGSLAGDSLAGDSLAGSSHSIGPSLFTNSTDMPTIGQSSGTLTAIQSSQITEVPASIPAVRITDPGWESAIARQVIMSQPGQPLFITVHPLTMGPIQVLATRAENGAMRIHITAQHADTVTLLQQGAPIIAAQIMGNGASGMGNNVTVTASSDQGVTSPAFSTSQQESQNHPSHSGEQSAFTRNAGPVHGLAEPSGYGVRSDSSNIVGTAGFESWV